MGQTTDYDQMYSSDIALSRHLATVTMRAPFSNSPITQVQSPEPYLIELCGKVVFGIHGTEVESLS